MKILIQLKSDKVKMFACGPTAMLKAIKAFCKKNDIECEDVNRMCNGLRIWNLSGLSY